MITQSKRAIWILLIALMTTLSVILLSKANAAVLDLQVGATSDDGYEYGNTGQVITNDPDENKIYSDSTISNDYRYGGFRWINVTIPPGATITAAYISVYSSYGSGYDNLNVDIRFEAADNPVTFVAGANNHDISSRSRTTAFTPWVANLPVGAWYNSPSIVSVVQEIVNRGGWSSGNAMAAIFVPKTDSLKYFRCRAYENPTYPGFGAKLHIEYTTTSTSPFKVGSFTKTTDIAPATQDVPHGLGETPKALILWVNGSSSNGTDGGFLFGFGVTDQARASYSVAASSQNGVTTTVCGRRVAAAALTIANFSGATLAEATVTAWDNNTFTLNWVTNNNQAYLIHFIAIGGTDVASKAVTWPMATAVGNQSVTGIGFKPDVVIHAHAGDTFNLAVGNGMPEAMLGLGVMDVSGNQWADFVFSRNARSTPDTQRGQRTDGCIYSFNRSLVMQKKAQFRSMDSDGFTVSFTNTTGAVAAPIVSLALKGINAKAGNFGKTVPAPTYVQSTSKNQLSSVVTLTFPSVSTSGNLIVLSIDHNDQSINVLSVTDSAGNSYQLAVGPTNWASERAYTYYANNIKGGSQITITITLSGTPSLYGEFYVAEYSGVATTNPLDQTSVATGTSSAFDSGSKTTTQASELIYGFVDSGSSVLTLDPSFTAREILNDNRLADKTVSSTGSYNFSGTFGSSTTWVAHMATFKGSGATQAVRGVGFQPAVVLLASVQNTIQTSDTAVTHTRFGIGAANGTSVGSSAFADRDATSPTSVQALDKTNKVFMKVNNTAGTVDAEADLASMDADGFTLNWTTNDAVATEIVYLALGTPGTASFQYKRQITINALSCSETLLNFPVLISLSGSWLRTQANDPTYGRIQNANGFDIIFRDASNNQLPHEIEKYDGGASAGTLVAWVSVPSLPQAGTTIYMYYGNSAITSPTANPTGVWDSDYVGVWHFSESGGASYYLKNSKQNNYDADAGSTAYLANPVGLSLDGARDFAGSYCDVQSGGSLLNGDSQFSLEFWAYPDYASDAAWTTAGEDSFLMSDSLNLCRWMKGTNPANKGHIQCDVTWSGGTNYFGNDGVLTRAQWNHIVLTYDGTNLRWYINGSQVQISNDPGRTLRTNSYLSFGDSTGARPIDSNFDEYRYSRVGRSPCWVRTEYDNQKAGSALVTILAEGGAAPTAVTLSGFTATEYEDGVLVEWKTGHEVNNLGFHIYREENGQLVRLTPEPVAGSALIAGSRTALTAGHHYHWWDASLSPQSSSLSPVRYWLKDIDLNGKQTMHGPVTPVLSKESIPEKFRPELLSEIGWRLNERYDHYWKVQELKEKLKQKSSVIGHRSSGNKVASNLKAGGRSSKLKPLRLSPQSSSLETIAVQQYLASRPAVKLMVREEGWYRVSQPELVAAGLNPEVNPRYIQLFVEGIEQPIRIIGRGAKFDAIEFYGVGLDTPSTDTRVYWLVEGSRPGKRIDEFKGYSGSLSSSSFPFTVEKKERTLYFAALLNGEGENFFGPVVYMNEVGQIIEIQHLDRATSEDALLEVVLQGATDTPHRVKVLLNEVEVGEIVFEGQGKGTLGVGIPQSMLEEGENLVTLVAMGDDMDASLLDTIRLTYWHSYTADNEGLRFTVQGGSHLTVNGFSHPEVRVIDITDSSDVIEVVGRVEPQKGGYSVSFRVPGTEQRTLLVLTEERVKSPIEIVFNHPSIWQQERGGYDLVIISHRDFFDSLEPLRQLRESQGYRVALIDVEDLYDEFSFGNKSPRAIRDFLVLAKANWSKAPRFVLLVGDASFDPRNYLGLGEMDYVPTRLIDTVYMETASDDWFVDLNNDGLPEMAVGRLPVQTAEEAGIVVSKIIGYEESSKKKEALLVADKNDQQGDFDFRSASEEVRALLPAYLTIRKIFRGEFGSDAQAKGELINGINQGPLLVNFIGHGSVEIWRGSLLTLEDADNLINGLRLPFFVNMTCLNGFFQNPYGETLAEALIKSEGGGAVAIWSSSGLTEPDKQAVMNKELIKLLFGREPITLGEATAKAKASVSDQDIRKTWILFGDPTTRLK
jgi:hypothetical protein